MYIYVCDNTASAYIVGMDLMGYGADLMICLIWRNEAYCTREKCMEMCDAWDYKEDINMI